MGKLYGKMEYLRENSWHHKPMGTWFGKIWEQWSGRVFKPSYEAHLIIDSWLDWTFRKLIYRRKIAVDCPKLRCLLVGGGYLPLWKIMEWVRQLGWWQTFPIWWESHLGIPWFQSPPTRWCIPNLQVCPFQNTGIWDLGGSQIWPTRWRRRHPIDISEWHLGVTTKGFVTIVARDARDVHRNHCMLLYMIYVTRFVKLKLQCLPWIISHVVLLKSPNCGT